MSDTPRTDAELVWATSGTGEEFQCVDESFARELEREIVALRAEPLIHTHDTDLLPESHPLAYECVYCERCESMLHCSNNECMSTWVEWKQRYLCGKCFGQLLVEDPAVHFSDFAERAKPASSPADTSAPRPQAPHSCP